MHDTQATTYSTLVFVLTCGIAHAVGTAGGDLWGAPRFARVEHVSGSVQSFVPLAARIPRCPGEAPTIDGVLAEPCWDAAYTAGDFIVLGGDKAASQQTLVRMLHAGGILYLGIVCMEDRMEHLVSAVQDHDGPVWEDDCVEIFVDADHDHQTYCQFVVNARGAAMDARLIQRGRLQTDWGCDWQRAVTRGTDRWSLEAAIPLDGLDGIRSAVLGLNVAREERPHSELSSWLPQQHHFGYTFDELCRFADVSLGEGVPMLTAFGVSALKLGINEATVRVLLPANTPGFFDFTIVGPDGTACADASARVPAADASGVSSFRIPFILREFRQGIYRLCASFRESAGARGHRLGCFPIELDHSGPLTLVSGVLIGRDSPICLSIAPVLGSGVLSAGCVQVSLRAEGLAAMVRRIPLVPLSPDCKGVLRLPLGDIPPGRMRLKAAILDGVGSPLGEGVDAEIIRLRGPFELDSVHTAVANPSFERVPDSGIPSDWQGVWWAPKGAGMTPVPVPDFVHAQPADAFDGRHCLRIASSRHGDAPADEVLHVRSRPFEVVPGVPYQLTVACRTDDLTGRGKIWLQLPKRQVVVIDGIADLPLWRRISGEFTPGADETTAQICLSLHGKGGTVWFDQVRWRPAPPGIASVLAPNSLMDTGVCRLRALPSGVSLTVHVRVFEAEGVRALATWDIPVVGCRIPLRLPELSGPAPARLVVQLKGAGGRIIDARSASLFVRAPPFGEPVSTD